MKPDLKVKAIKNGTVIDHVTANKALQVLKILGLPDEKTQLTIAMNTSSKTLGHKDILKIENRELKSEELDQLSLIAPQTTINIVRDYEIVNKGQVEIVNEVHGILKCNNPNCITNTDEPLQTKFYTISKDPLELRCHYCERIMNQDEVSEQF